MASLSNDVDTEGIMSPLHPSPFLHNDPSSILTGQCVTPLLGLLQAQKHMEDKEKNRGLTKSLTPFYPHQPPGPSALEK